ARLAHARAGASALPASDACPRAGRQPRGAAHPHQDSPRRAGAAAPRRGTNGARAAQETRTLIDRNLTARSFMSQSTPPGPRFWFFNLGQVRLMKADLPGYYRNLQATYGDCVYMRLGPYHDYTFFHPEQVREMLVTKARSFQRMAAIRKIMSKLDGDGL